MSRFVLFATSSLRHYVFYWKVRPKIVSGEAILRGKRKKKKLKCCLQQDLTFRDVMVISTWHRRRPLWNVISWQLLDASLGLSISTLRSLGVRLNLSMFEFYR